MLRKIILLIEDNPDDEALTIRALKQNSIVNDIVVAHDGAEALDYLFCKGRYAHRRFEDLPHLVLLDLHLPKVGGMEVLHRIKTDERTRSIPVVVLTVSQNNQELAECRRMGAETFIVKPVDVPRLCEVTPKLSLYWTLFRPNAPIDLCPDR